MIDESVGRTRRKGGGGGGGAQQHAVQVTCS